MYMLPVTRRSIHIPTIQTLQEKAIMRTYVISRKPEVLDWNTIPALPIDNMYWCDPVDIVSQAQLCYDEEAIYVRLSTKEANIRAEVTDPLGSPCLDSCLEFFFSPVPEDDRYINIELNPLCSMYLGIGHSTGDLIRMIPDGHDVFGPVVERTEEGWNITYKVPVAFLNLFFKDFAPAPGKFMKANFYKCGNYCVVPHYFTWNALSGKEGGFHRPCDFGTLEFA